MRDKDQCGPRQIAHTNRPICMGVSDDFILLGLSYKMYGTCKLLMVNMRNPARGLGLSYILHGRLFWGGELGHHTFWLRHQLVLVERDRQRPPAGRKHMFGGFSPKIFSFSPSNFFSESSSMRAAQNWAQSYWARGGYPRTQISEFGGPCRGISSR